MEDHTIDYRDPYEWMERVRRSSFPPLVICVAITGGVQGKESNPNLPETPEEQAEQTYEAYKAGASMVHIHARDPEKWYDGCGDPEQYRKIHRLIRKRCPDIIINDSTGGTSGMTAEERLACLDANPEVATLNLGPDMYMYTIKERKAPILHPRPEQHWDGCDTNTYGEVRAFAQRMKERGIKPEMEIYNPGDFWLINYVISEGLAAPPYLVQFVMGYQAGIYPTPSNVLNMMYELPAPCVFEIAGIAQYQLPMNVLGLVLGVHMVRVGLEDNVYYKRGQLLENNAEAVERIVRIANEMNREIATPSQSREILGISQTASTY